MLKMTNMEQEFMKSWPEDPNPEWHYELCGKNYDCCGWNGDCNYWKYERGEEYEECEKCDEDEVRYCGVGDTNIWSPKGCRLELTDGDEQWIDDGRGTAPYCRGCFPGEDDED